MKPVRDLRVIRSPPWSESTKARIRKPIPREEGAFDGISSRQFPYGVADQS